MFNTKGTDVILIDTPGFETEEELGALMEKLKGVENIVLYLMVINNG